MINFHNSKLISTYIHYLPKNEGTNQPQYSNQEIILNESFTEAIYKMLQSNFKLPTYYSFDYHNEDVILNPLYNYISNSFDDIKSLLENSIKTAKLLFEKSKNSFIEGGFLLFGVIEDILVEDEITRGVFIIKLEEKTNIFDIDLSPHNINQIIEKTGYSLEKPHKLCLILDIDRDNGYKILQSDPKNKVEAEYWFKEFLFLKPYSDKHYFTNDYIKLTVNFAKKSGVYKEDETVDKIDLCNKTKTYFSNNEHFVEDDFLDNVFEDSRKKIDFLEFKNNVEADSNKTYATDFEISETMVNKNNKIFKSIIKLDKNFHIYIHGNREKIERCVDPDGTKYYKIYFDSET
ncbi:MAG TPA: nucleoid-associated protein [Saprospiraceae bacterium]|nr:nucleoid-associated protein [Saprospiraceae bacterium]